MTEAERGGLIHDSPRLGGRFRTQTVVDGEHNVGTDVGTPLPQPVREQHREGRTVVLKFGARSKVDPTRMVGLVRRRGDLTILPPSGLKLSLDGVSTGPGAKGQAPAARGVPPRPQAPTATGRKKRPEIAPSWWTARAKEGEVRPGFTKAEILKAKPDDPRAPGGVFERVGGLLSEMLE